MKLQSRLAPIKTGDVAKTVFIVRQSFAREILKGPVTKQEYVIYVRNNICGGLVDDRDAARFCEIPGGCCGNVRGKMYRQGTVEERVRWERNR
jgi:hypothetical protein